MLSNFPCFLFVSKAIFTWWLSPQSIFTAWFILSSQGLLKWLPLIDGASIGLNKLDYHYWNCF